MAIYKRKIGNQVRKGPFPKAQPKEGKAIRKCKSPLVFNAKSGKCEIPANIKKAQEKAQEKKDIKKAQEKEKTKKS